MGISTDFQMELLSFDEKIALAELEEAKANERVKELKYQKARFGMQSFLAAMKADQANKGPDQ